MIQKTYKAPKHFTEKELRSQIKRSWKLMFSGWIIVMVGVVGFVAVTFLAPDRWLDVVQPVGVLTVLVGLSAIFLGTFRMEASLFELNRRQRKKKGIREDDDC